MPFLTDRFCRCRQLPVYGSASACARSDVAHCLSVKPPIGESLQELLFKIKVRLFIKSPVMP